MSWRLHLLLFIVLVPLFNTLAVLALPYTLNAYVMHRIVKQALAEAAVPSDDPTVQARKNRILERDGINIALPAPRADADSTTVVRPSPDLLYTACVFDLSKGPVHITAPVPDGYLSISGFAADTSNFFAVNDRDAEQDAGLPRSLDLWITHHSASAPEAAQRTVSAPTRRGLVLFRTLVQDRSVDRALAQIRAAQRCDGG
ncbi:MAG: DUF1254 domain-containing protein [Pseudomonadota bacterium]|nr:DUF1254 domain-containing protein [Pseudomonadota bacterium]